MRFMRFERSAKRTLYGGRISVSNGNINSQSDPPSKKPSALVVEDEALIAMFLADMLDDVGFEVVTAATVAESLAAVRAHDVFSVAFIDLSLPDRPGLELISDLQIMHPRLPIVIASGYGSMAARDATDDSRCRPVLCKPYDQQMVVRVLSTLGLATPDLSTPDLSTPGLGLSPS